jgi:Uma2 family endonuclease
MSGGTAPHSQIAANIIMYLGIAARGGRCRVYTSDFKIQPSDEAVYYPDVSVVCEPPARSAVVTSLRAYLIVDQFSPRDASLAR